MDSTIQRFFSPCPRGLETVLERELHGMSIDSTERTDGGVAFRGPWFTLYRVNLESRIASRVLWQVGRASYRTEQDVYRAAYELAWEHWFEPSRSLKVKVSARRCPLTSLDFLTLRIKDAICDRFMAVRRRRPNVDTHRPDVRIDVFLDETSVTLYLDTSGEPLFKRGFRHDTVAAPLRENLAAGLLRLTGWTGDRAFVDPMCGGGTIPLEAALMARCIAPGWRRSFAFERCLFHDAKAWSRFQETAQTQQLGSAPCQIHASDQNPESVSIAARTFQAAGVATDIRLERTDLLTLEPPAAQGVMLLNPPYGVRLGASNKLAELYPKIGDWLKQRWAGWRVYVFTGDARFQKLIGLTASKRIPLFNGSLECRLYEFEIVAGSMRKRSRRAHDNG